MQRVLRSQFVPKQLGQFLYRVMEPKDYDQAVEISAKAFTQHEPFCLSVNTSLQDMEHFFYSFKEQVFKDPMSVVAIDTNKNIVVGAEICEDYNLDFKLGDADHLPMDCRTMVNFLQNIRGDLIKSNKISGKLNETYNMLISAIHPDYQGMGIMKEVAKANYEVAWSLGFNYLISEVTSPVSQHIYAKAGYDVLYFYPYNQLQKAMPHLKINEQLLCKDFRKGVEPGIRIMIKQIK